jgi:hypothetical protein
MALDKKRRFPSLVIRGDDAICWRIFFFPRVTVESSGPYDPSNPSPITFTISNINIVPLRNVQFAIGLCYITPPERGITLRGGDSGSGTNPLECNGPAGTKIVFMPWTIKWLDTDEKYQVALKTR